MCSRKSAGIAGVVGAQIAVCTGRQETGNNMSGERTLSARPRPKPPVAEQSGRPQNLQDAFLNLLRKNKAPVTMFLVKGVKLQGIVTWFDNFSILLRRDGQSQLVYKHAISTIMPGQPISLYEGDD